MNKIFVLKFILALSLINTCFGSYTSLPSLDEQKQLLSDISSNSWRKQIIKDIDGCDKTVNQCLIDAINLRNNIRTTDLEQKQKERFNNIINQLSYDFISFGEHKNFWEKKFRKNNALSEDYILKNIFLGSLNHQESSILPNNSRVQQIILNMQELMQFKKSFLQQAKDYPENPMISHFNFITDDVIRALSLSGTFCKIVNNKFVPKFSGMLAPGQNYSNQNFKIHSCMHGFKNGYEEVYFVPYGIELNDLNGPNFSNSFKIVSVKRKKYLSDSQFIMEDMSNDALKNLDKDFEYNSPDYALVSINKRSVDGEYTLRGILFHRQTVNVFNDFEETSVSFRIKLFPGFIESVTNLPNLINSSSNHDYFKDFSLTSEHLETCYIIGRPGDARLALNESGFAIVTNLTDKTNFKPLHSLNNDPDLYMPPNIGSIDRITLDYPSHFGMSGGIVLQTLPLKINQTSSTQTEETVLRIARLIGTVWGAERSYNNKSFELNSFVNKIH